MKTPFLPRSPFRGLLVHRLLLVASVALCLSDARAQSTLANNNAQQGDFQSKENSHSWTVELPEDFNDLRIQIESPTASVKVFVLPEGKAHGIALKAMRGKGSGSALVGMKGKDLEIFSESKLAKGRYTIQITPNDRQPAGKYSIKIVEPKLAPEAAKPEGAPPPAPGPGPSPTPQSKPDADIHAQILAELKALRDQVKAVEGRLEAMEGARKEK